MRNQAVILLLAMLGATTAQAADTDRDLARQLALQQKNLLAHPERALLMLNIDTGGVQSRKILDRLVAAERAAGAVSAA